MLPRDGGVKIVDFGIAKLTAGETMTETGATFGTVAYMAPEQVRGEVSDARADVWALGVVFYEMLTGVRPFAGESAEGTAMAILTTEPPAVTERCPELPASVASAVTACLQKSRDERCPSADAMVEQLVETAAPIPSTTAPTLPVVVDAEPSVAVLPFANLSADPEQEYFCDGLAEDVLDALARLEGLRVASRSSAFRFREKGQDLREVGRKLAVKTVLEGSVRRAGNRLRINTQLVNTDDGYQLWSDRYDRQLDDIFEVQDEIARAVVRELEVKLLPKTGQSLVARPTDNLDAYTCYMRGRHYRTSRYDPEKAVEHFAEAVRLDPLFVPAWVGLADATIMLAYLGLRSPHELRPRAQAAAERALSLDHSFWGAQLSLAKIQWFFDWQWEEAERVYARVVDLAPRNVDVRTGHASILAFHYRIDEALAEPTGPSSWTPCRHMRR